MIISATQDLLRLPNVTIDPRHTKDGTPTLRCNNSILPEVTSKLAIKEPTWNFVLDGYSTNGTMMLNDVKVTYNGEELGELGLDYYRGDYRVVIESHRVQTSRGKHRTADVAKALAICKKVFVPRSLHERLNKSLESATRSLSASRHEFYSIIHRTEHMVLDSAARTFAVGRYKDEFYEYVKALDPTKHPQMLERYEDAKMHHMTVEQVYQKFNSGETALVVIDSGKYIVRHKDSVQMFDADTLPENLRGKLGILKLVEEGQVVSATGCRVNTEVFVVVVDEAQA